MIKPIYQFLLTCIHVSYINENRCLLINTMPCKESFTRRFFFSYIWHCMSWMMDSVAGVVPSWWSVIVGPSSIMLSKAKSIGDTEQHHYHHQIYMLLPKQNQCHPQALAGYLNLFSGPWDTITQSYTEQKRKFKVRSIIPAWDACMQDQSALIRAGQEMYAFCRKPPGIIGIFEAEWFWEWTFVCLCCTAWNY